MKLVESTHIEHATRNIKRHYLIIFSQEEDENIKRDLVFGDFLNKRRKKNATSLHCGIMTQCGLVLAIAAAERLGGPDGYHLHPGAVKVTIICISKWRNLIWSILCSSFDCSLQQRTITA